MRTRIGLRPLPPHVAIWGLTLVVLSACAHRDATQSNSEEFQWTLSTSAAIFFVDQDDYLYAAERRGIGVIETNPPKIRGQIFGATQTIAYAIPRLRSPYAIDPADWVLQRRIDGEWIDADSFSFDGQSFITPDATIGMGELADVRFRARAEKGEGRRKGEGRWKGEGR